jgi:hypothetical protein
MCRNDMMSKNQLERLFKKYCDSCNAFCCKTKEITVFKFELDNIQKIGWDDLSFLNQGREKSHRGSHIKRIRLKNGCPFVTNSGCIFSPNYRPIDCLSYPIYPVLKYKGKNALIEYMAVHKSCPKYKAISKDLMLIKSLYSFWNEIIKESQTKDLKEWFGDKKNYWMDKNLIKIKIA